MNYGIYRNLHNGLLSIKEMDSGLVVGHCDSVALKAVEWKANLNGIKRIRATQEKYVVALVVGEVVHAFGFTPYKGRKLAQETGQGTLPLYDTFEGVKFNPYRFDGFVKDTEQHELIKQSDGAIVTKQGHMSAMTL